MTNSERTDTQGYRGIERLVNAFDKMYEDRQQLAKSLSATDEAFEITFTGRLYLGKECVGIIERSWDDTCWIAWIALGVEETTSVKADGFEEAMRSLWKNRPIIPLLGK